ncbi:alpha/beta hydrolase family protein [Pseudoalteromonas sp. ASV78]|uniref:alpha/beta hydrolase family protein n=1 Tax=Pseudoalteromonas sp. ASV78 TaxID=3397851 RepID=UPI0039FDA32C
MFRAILICFAFISTSTYAKENPWDAYAHLPIVEQPQISPNGEMIATVYNADDGPTVSITKFPSIELNILARMKKKRDRVDFIRWSGDKYVIVSTSYPEYSYGQFLRISRLYAFDVTTGEHKVLTTKRFSKSRFYKYQSFRLVSSLKHETDYALVSTYDENDSAYSVFRVNLGDSQFEKIQRNEEDISSWYADNKGVVRLGIAVEEKDDKFTASVWYRAKKEDELKKIHTHTWGEDSTFSIEALTTDGTKAYVMSDRELGREALWLYDIASGEFESLVYSHDSYDLSNTIRNSEGDLIGVGYYDDFYQTHYFSEEDAQQEQAVGKLFRDKQVTIASRNRDHNRLLAYVVSDSSIPVYYYFDLNTKKGGVWLAQYPYLASKEFTTVQSYNFKASDGMNISGYYTQPKEAKQPPLIVMPHGGPNARDYKYFNKELQYLVSLGYGVLQVNFRGSAGFGSQFETAGYYQWGKRMQQDVYDAMDWAIDSGLAKKGNACIYGSSYGGYVALTAAAQEPYRFKCIISVSGVSDLETFVEGENRQGSYLGNIVDMTDSNAVNALADVSAINMIDKIKAPVLLIHGDNDTRVDYRQSSAFYSKAKNHVDVKYVEIKDGTHFFDDLESQKILFSEVSTFLQKNL